MNGAGDMSGLLVVIYILNKQLSFLFYELAFAYKKISS